MKKKYFIFILLLCGLVSCTDKNEPIAEKYDVSGNYLLTTTVVYEDYCKYNLCDEPFIITKNTKGNGLYNCTCDGINRQALLQYNPNTGFYQFSASHVYNEQSGYDNDALLIMAQLSYSEDGNFIVESSSASCLHGTVDTATVAYVVKFSLLKNN